MNIAIIGYGKMGREIEKAALAKGIKVKSIIDSSDKNAGFKEITKESLKEVDVCIDFSSPGSALSNLRKASSFKKNFVMGTTGWYDNIDEAKTIVKKSGIGFVYGSNFSIGVNVFFRIVDSASEIMNSVEGYDVFGYELHHNNKADSPSGTAKTLGEILLKNIRRKNKMLFDRIDRKINPEEIHFASLRAGSIPGTHVVGFDSGADTIELKHTARNREGFALGAVIAADWIKSKKGFYSVDDMMKNIIGA